MIGNGILATIAEPVALGLIEEAAQDGHRKIG